MNREDERQKRFEFASGSQGNDIACGPRFCMQMREISGASNPSHISNLSMKCVLKVCHKSLIKCGPEKIQRPKKQKPIPTANTRTEEFNVFAWRAMESQVFFTTPIVNKIGSKQEIGCSRNPFFPLTPILRINGVSALLSAGNCIKIVDLCPPTWIFRYANISLCRRRI